MHVQATNTGSVGHMWPQRAWNSRAKETQDDPKGLTVAPSAWPAEPIKNRAIAEAKKRVAGKSTSHVLLVGFGVSPRRNCLTRHADIDSLLLCIASPFASSSYSRASLFRSKEIRSLNSLCRCIRLKIARGWSCFYGLFPSSDRGRKWAIHSFPFLSGYACNGIRRKNSADGFIHFHISHTYESSLDLCFHQIRI